MENQLRNQLNYIQSLLGPVYMEVGDPSGVGEVTCAGSPHLSCKRDKIKMRDYIDRWITPPKLVTSPAWGPPHPFKQALSFCFQSLLQ